MYYTTQNTWMNTDPFFNSLGCPGCNIGYTLDRITLLFMDKFSAHRATVTLLLLEEHLRQVSLGKYYQKSLGT